MSSIIPRTAWGARPAKSRTSIGRVDGVAAHWEGGPAGLYTPEQSAGLVRGIQNFHMDRRGWSDIAYSFLVSRHGQIYEGRGLGARSAANGSNDANANWYAVCLMLGEGDPFPEAAKRGARDAIDYLRRNGAGRQVEPHSTFFNTACPGAGIRSWVRIGMPSPEVPLPPPIWIPIGDVDVQLSKVGLQVPLDSKGNGWRWFDVPFERVFSWGSLGSNPPRDKTYFPGTPHAQQDGGRTLVSVTDGAPSGSCLVFLTVAQ